MKTINLFIGLIIYLTNCFTTVAQDVVNKTLVLDTVKNEQFVIDSATVSNTLVSKIEADTVKNDTVNPKPARSSVISSKIETNSADSIIYSIDGKKVYYFGNAEVNYEDINLKAAYIEVDMENGILYAEGAADSTGAIVGQPIFTQDAQEMKAKTITYNLQTEKGFIKGLYTEQDEGYLHSQSTKKEPDNSINLHRGKYSTCELEDPHFYVWMSKGKVVPDKAIVAGFSFMVVEDVPLYPLAIPFGFFPNTKEKASGFLIPTFGDEVTRGFYLRDGGYYFAFSEYADLALKGDIYSKGSWQIGAQSKYRLRYKYSGNVDIAYSKQVVGEDGLSTYSESSEYRIVWSHRQDPKAKPNSDFNANVNFRSMGDNKYNATSYNERLDQTISSSISYRKKFANSPLSTSMNLRHNQNMRDSTVSLVLPQFTANMSRIYPFRKKVSMGKTKWYENIGLTYTGNFENKVTTKDSILFTNEVFDLFKYGAKHSIPLSTSIKVLKHVNLSPSISFNDRMYFKRTIRDYETDSTYVERDENGFYNIYDYGYSMGMGTKMYGMFQYKNSKIKAIRHVATPSVSLSYRPDFSEDKFGFYVKDTNETKGYYDPYADHSIYDMPGTGKNGSVGFTLNNNLEMKVQSKKDTVDGDKKIKLLEALNFSTSYNIIADSLNWSPLRATARTTLFNMFTINVSASGDFYSIDSSGAKYNTFHYETSGKPIRLTTLTATTGIKLNSKNLFGKSDGKPSGGMEGNPEDMDRQSYLEYYNYDYFDIPWNLGFDYNFSYSKPKTTSIVSQKLSISGDLSLTSKWKVGFRSGWDFDAKQFSYTSFNISRDLHCWVATVNVIPFGQYQSYNFTIGVKSSVLQDLKYNKNKSWLDNTY